MDAIAICAKNAAKAEAAYLSALRKLPPVMNRDVDQQNVLDTLQDAKRRALYAWSATKLSDPDWHPLKHYPSPGDYRSMA